MNVNLKRIVKSLAYVGFLSLSFVLAWTVKEGGDHSLGKLTNADSLSLTARAYADAPGAFSGEGGAACGGCCTGGEGCGGSSGG
jgi:hypothetical protein